MGTFAKTGALILLVNKDFNSATSKKKKKMSQSTPMSYLLILSMQKLHTFNNLVAG